MSSRERMQRREGRLLLLGRILARTMNVWRLKRTVCLLATLLGQTRFKMTDPEYYARIASSFHQLTRHVAGFIFTSSPGGIPRD